MSVSLVTGAATSVLASIPTVVPNQCGGQDVSALDGRTFQKMDPATGRAESGAAQAALYGRS